MKIDEVEDNLLEIGIRPISVVRLSENDNLNYFLFNGEIAEYFNILVENQIKCVFCEKIFLTEDDFLYPLDEEDEEIIYGDSQIELDEEIGAIKMDLINPNLKEYSKYIGTVRVYKIYSIINGKELVAKIDQEWNDKFIGQHLTAIDQIEERIAELRENIQRHMK